MYVFGKLGLKTTTVGGVTIFSTTNGLTPQTTKNTPQPFSGLGVFFFLRLLADRPQRGQAGRRASDPAAHDLLGVVGGLTVRQTGKALFGESS